MLNTKDKNNIELVIIEDEPDILELLEYHLTKEGYSVMGFLSTEHVEQFLEEENPALLIVDRNLLGVEGSEFKSSFKYRCGDRYNNGREQCDRWCGL